MACRLRYGLLMKRRLGVAVSLLKESFNQWMDDQAPVLGAALSYYTVFSLAPLLVLAIAIAGMAFGEEAARGEIVGAIQGLVGREGGLAVQTMIENASRPSEGILATVIGVAVLLFGASGAFAQLQNALNVIWKVAVNSNFSIGVFLKRRFFSFAMVLSVGFLLLVSLAISAALAALGKFFAGALPGGEGFWQVANFLISLGVVTLLFAMIFKFVPDARIAWGDVWIGALLTAVLFSVGKFLMGLYLGSSTIGSTFGAAGSLVVLLIWIYYSAQILFFGAEFTRVYALRYGSGLRPVPGAHLIRPLTRIDGKTKDEREKRAQNRT